MAFLKENLELLLEKGASINAQDCNGATALMSCCSRRDTDPTPGIEVLLAHNAQLDIKGELRLHMVIFERTFLV